MEEEEEMAVTKRGGHLRGQASLSRRVHRGSEFSRGIAERAIPRETSPAEGGGRFGRIRPLTESVRWTVCSALSAGSSERSERARGRVVDPFALLSSGLLAEGMV